MLGQGKKISDGSSIECLRHTVNLEAQVKTINSSGQAGRTRSKVSAGQQGIRDESELCFGMVHP